MLEDTMTGSTALEGMRHLLDPRAVQLDAWAADRDDAVRQCGRILVGVGAVTPAYTQSMLERERFIPTYLGDGVAIPHGNATGRNAVLRDALAVLRFPGEVDWDGPRVTMCIAIAARGYGYLAIMAELAEIILLDPERAKRLREATSVQDVLRLLQPAEEECNR